MNEVWIVSSNADDKQPVRQVFAKKKDAEAYVEEIFSATDIEKGEDNSYYAWKDENGVEDEYWEVEKFVIIQ